MAAGKSDGDAGNYFLEGTSIPALVGVGGWAGTGKMWPLIPGYSVTGAGEAFGGRRRTGGRGLRGDGGEGAAGAPRSSPPRQGARRRRCEGRRWTGGEPNFLGVL